MLYDEARMALTKERLEDLRKKKKSCPLNSFPSSLQSVASTSAIQISKIMKSTILSILCMAVPAA